MRTARADEDTRCAWRPFVWTPCRDCLTGLGTSLRGFLDHHDDAAVIA